MSLSDVKFNDHLDLEVDQVQGRQLSLETEFSPDEADLLENINSTPVGQLLKIISSLPDIRQDKVFAVRRQIDHGHYNLGENLDAALDMVLEELIAEG